MRPPYKLIDLCNRLHLFRCDRCGKRMKGWKPTLPYEVPLCGTCWAYIGSRP